MTMGIKSMIKMAFPIIRRTKSENGVEKTCAPHHIHKETQLQETAKNPPQKYQNWQKYLYNLPMYDMKPRIGVKTDLKEKISEIIKLLYGD